MTEPNNNHRVPALVAILGCCLQFAFANINQGDERYACNLTAWKSYKLQFDKHYADGSSDDQQRQLIFCANLEKIARHNANPNKTFTMGVNYFADKSDEEMAQMYARNIAHSPIHGMKPLSPRNLGKLINVNEAPPAQLDWSENPRRVSSIRDQGDCGSCWAHTTVAMLEGQEMPAESDKLVELSEQNLIDCDRLNFACQGGVVFYALKEIRRFGGIMALKDYPYESGLTSRAGRCRMSVNKTHKTTRKLDEPQWLEPGNETLLMQVVASYGPVAVSIHATNEFKLYQDGIYYSRFCDNVVNHGVVIVGYGTMNGSEYWKVKNSWSSKWGRQGYGLMARNKNDHCRISTQAFIVTYEVRDSEVNGNYKYNQRMPTEFKLKLLAIFIPIAILLGIIRSVVKECFRKNHSPNPVTNQYPDQSAPEYPDQVPQQQPSENRGRVKFQVMGPIPQG